MPSQIKKNIISKTILSITNIAVPIFIGPYVVRVLDIVLYTEFHKSMSLMAWFMPFAIFGVSTYGLREISRVRNDKQKLNSAFSEFFIINIVTSIVVFILFFIIIIRNNAYFYIYLIISFQVLFTFLNVEYFNEGFERYGFILYKNLILRLLYIVCIFSFVRKPGDIINYVIITTSNVILNNIFSYLYIKRSVILIKPEKEKLIKTIKGLFIALILFNSGMLYTVLDRLFLTLFTDNYDITYFSVSQNILTALMNVFLSIILVTIPRLSFYYGNNYHNEYNELLKKSSSLFYLLAIPSCIGICIFGTYIMILYGSDKLVQAGPVLSLFSLQYIIYAIDCVASKQVLFVTGNEKLLIKIYFLGGFINLIGNLMLFYFGILSAVSVIITTTIADIVVMFIEQYKIKKINKSYVAINASFLKYFIISVLTIIILRQIFLKLFSVISIIEIITFMCTIIGVFLLLYVLILYLLKDEIIHKFIFDLKYSFNKRICPNKK